MYNLWNFKKIKGFTLIEVLVTVSIISILAAVIAINSVDAGKQSRDEKRQADIRNLQSALELYKNKYGRYPEACDSRVNAWAGQQGGSYACANGNSQYIVNLAPEFISVLPIDPKLSGTDSGYVYRTNANGTVYKLMAMNTVESEVVSYSHPLKSCDIVPGSNGTDYPGTNVNQINDGGWCSQVPNSIISSPINPKLPQCTMMKDNGGINDRFEKSYGVWGGFEAKTSGGNEATRVRNTTTVICQ